MASRLKDEQALAAIARSIIDSNRYMTLGTADESGLPWMSPAWYAVAEYRESFWVSSPEARHSRNVDAGEILPPAPLRLYHATASEHFVLGPGDRPPVSLAP